MFFMVFFNQSTEDYPSNSGGKAFMDIVKFKLQHTKIYNWLLIGSNTNAFL